MEAIAIRLEAITTSSKKLLVTKASLLVTLHSKPLTCHPQNKSHRGTGLYRLVRCRCPFLHGLGWPQFFTTKDILVLEEVTRKTSHTDAPLSCLLKSKGVFSIPNFLQPFHPPWLLASMIWVLDRHGLLTNLTEGFHSATHG